ncbi:MAG: DUF4293 domain-containing protein [Bacteroidota bacterium]
MIQRIQTVFLLLTALTLIAALFFPIWSEVNPERTEQVELNVYELRYEQLNPDGSTGEIISRKDTYYISLFLFAGAIVAFISIFQYKNRLRQIQLGALNSLIIGGSIIFTWFVYINPADLVVDPTQQGKFEVSFYLPLVALLLNSFANRFIRRDEKLVRSADRLR